MEGNQCDGALAVGDRVYDHRNRLFGEVVSVLGRRVRYRSGPLRYDVDRDQVCYAPTGAVLASRIARVRLGWSDSEQQRRLVCNPCDEPVVHEASVLIGRHAVLAGELRHCMEV